MDREEASARFAEADELYRIGDYAGALYILDDLDRAFPQQHRLIAARARCLSRLNRHDEALVLCDRLIGEFRYAKAEALRDRILQRRVVSTMETGGGGLSLPDDAGEPEEEVASSLSCGRLVQLLVAGLAAVVCAGLAGAAALGWLSWETAGITAAVILGAAVVGPWLSGRLLSKLGRRLFETPFRMKAKALDGARIEVHNVSSADPPEDDDEDDDDAAVKGPRTWYWIDVTITPSERTEGFTHWEPGELTLADATRQIRTMDDLDHAHQVQDVQVVENGAIYPWEGEKYQGPMRIKVLVGFPKGVNRAQFVYYTTAFGEVELQ